MKLAILNSMLRINTINQALTLGKYILKPVIYPINCLRTRSVKRAPKDRANLVALKGEVA